MELKNLKGIPYNFSVAKRAMLFSLIASIFSILASLIWSIYITLHFTENAYVISEKGLAAVAKKADGALEEYRLPEIKNHIRVFHELFWTYDQFSFNRNMEKALDLIGNSGKDIYLSLKANGHFSNIQSQNLSQTIIIDSIKVDPSVKPYQASVFGKLSVKRTDQAGETITPFISSMELNDVTRTDTNPHGLLIENYTFSQSKQPK